MKPKKRRIAGLIVAAGLSSRMQAFKPLLPLGDGTVVSHAVNGLKAAGVRDVRAVVGFRGNELAAHLSSIGVPSATNESYAGTHMFESVAIGLKWLSEDADAVFVLPGDVPLVKRHSIKALIKAYLNTDAPLIYPAYRGRRGHPPLIAKACFPAILAHGGEDGLRGALRRFEREALTVGLPDPGLLMDADTPTDYERLCRSVRDAEVPPEEVCEAILAWACTPEASIAHARVVGCVAARLAGLLKDAGHPVDPELALAGGLLHDVAKGKKDHGLRGARLLWSLGYPVVAGIVHAHNDPPGDAVSALDERALVYLADKLVLKTSVVGIDARFARAFARFGDDAAVSSNIQKRKGTALGVANRIADILGKPGLAEVMRLL
ncbi:MAG: DVU_1551 family NTP transferase [Christensenellales bacterium]